MILNFQSILILVSLLGFNCHVDTDKIKPSIELISPVDISEIRQGEALKVSVVLSDNIALEDYKISIAKGGSEDLCFVKSFSCNHLTNACVDADGNALPIIKGKQNVKIDFNIGVEKDAFVGDYYFSLVVKDKAGNKHIKKRCFTVTRC